MFCDSGKSTQVPSFILESDMYLGKHVKILCTEPRRISATSLAQRVSRELGDSPGACGGRTSLVGYSIRLEARTSSSTRLIYATTGIVLRMLENEASTEDITHIIIDEVHERSIESDFLLIILKQLMEVRKDLKVILMSATLEAEKISEYMGGCPIINVPGRTFPVTSHYLEDVVELCHYRLTPNSDSPYLARNFRSKNSSRQWEEEEAGNDEDDRKDEKGLSLSNTYSSFTKTTLSVMDPYVINYELIMSLLETICITNQFFVSNYSRAILIFMPSLESIRRLTEMLEAHKLFGSKAFVVFPLHSTISNDNQGLVFEVPKPGIRKIVVSTNIAETGITIPDIQCVIDTGKHREMRFDEKRQISHLVETFIAKSNVAQRRGRAGRVQEGIAFHLFSKERYENIMDEHPQPEMMRLSLQDLALRIKILKIGEGGIEDTLAKALDPPISLNVQRAIASLVEVKALTPNEDITPLGRHLVKLPLDVHLAKFLIFSCLFQCLDAALTIAAVLNSKSPFVTPFGRENEADTVKRSFKVENSDFLAFYKAYVMWRQACQSNSFREFCRKNFLSHQNLIQIEELRGQYFNYLCDAGFISISDHERRATTSIRYGRARCRFTKVPAELDTYSADPKAVMSCLAASMYPKLIMVEPGTGALKTVSNNAPVQIHPSSVNFEKGRKVDFGQGVRFVTFFTIMRSTKLYVWESGTVDERAVYLLCGDADIKLPAYSLTLDRKIRTRLSPSTAISFKFMRKGFQNAFQAKMLKPWEPLSPQLQTWFDLVKQSVVGELEGTKEEDQAQTKVTVSLAKQSF
ncbi:P-loop containing nucleoside triphosphate hydrolase protein [Atractiella rhizophila]|nr:P-loop containing nucleoside triphosphate hydrolase protein [Atractiella rhizophila]